MAADRPRIAGKVSVVGVGETTYYKQGQAPVPEFTLAVEAIGRAAADAGMDTAEIDGFFSFSGDRSEPTRLAVALGARELRAATMVWGGGGGGVAAAVANAAAALVAGMCDVAVVYRSLAQGQFGRYGRAPAAPAASGPWGRSAPYGLLTPAQTIALRTRRFMHETGMTENALAAVALTCYAHAQRNPRAVMYGRPLTRDAYFASRWIVEPFRLYDCCLENDGAAAVVLTRNDRARDGARAPVGILAAAQGSAVGYDLFDHATGDHASANFRTLVPHLYGQAGIGPADVDVAQIYENFTGAVVMSAVEHGLCERDEVNEFFTEDNLRFDGEGTPLNTSGGNLAECYMHGMGLVIEGVRQLRGESTAQVDGAEIVLVAGGPTTAPVSSLVLNR